MYLKLIFVFILFSTILSAGVPIVTVEENNRLEELADETGVNEWRFMTNAGLAIAEEAERMINFNKNSTITLLIGKGYKGGNALWAGLLLQQKGYHVEACLLFSVSEIPSICQKIVGMFEEAGGVIHSFDSSLNTNTNLIIDGLIGAGFKGVLRGVFAQAIQWANESGQPILAVDIPSGLNGNTGEVETVAIRAKHTVAFFFPRVGYFLRKGWNHVGAFSVVNLGLDDEILDQINPAAYLISSNESLKYLDSTDFLHLDRQKFASLFNQEPEFTFDEYQGFSEEHGFSMLFTDLPKIMIIPSEKPKVVIDVHLYKISEAGQIHEIGPH